MDSTTIIFALTLFKFVYFKSFCHNWSMILFSPPPKKNEAGLTLHNGNLGGQFPLCIVNFMKVVMIMGMKVVMKVMMKVVMKVLIKVVIKVVLKVKGFASKQMNRHL